MPRCLVVVLVALVIATCGRAPIARGTELSGRMPAFVTRALRHDTLDSLYRSPFGAVPAGTAVTLRLRTATAGVSNVTLDVRQVDGTNRVVRQFQQSLHRSSAPAGSGYALWETRLTPASAGVYDYDFLVRQGPARAWYSATPLQDAGKGLSYPSQPRPTFRITVYDPSFAPPSWARDAVIYQIFPDRFYNGDGSNDKSVMDPVYSGIHPVIHTGWTGKPRGPYDFFGGDLQGILDKLSYLKGFGINTLYLNPIFMAPSNHKYDTSDYYNIDPHFGTLQLFDQLLAAAQSDGIRVILDGVFGYTGSDSVYFNRYGHFPQRGAYQTQDSLYYSWYTFTHWPDSYQTSPGVSQSRDTRPRLNESDPVKQFFFRTGDSVAQYWLRQGAAGWQLDAAEQKSHVWWQDFRATVKAAYPDAILIAAPSGRASNARSWLLGNEMDGVVNYRFREALVRFFARGFTADVARPLSVTGLYSALMSVLQDYPLPAVYSSMNVVDSHDRQRILYSLRGNKRRLREVATLQMTWPGIPTIYYGDEAGLSGGKVPDNRRTFPWGKEDSKLQAFYRSIIHIRNTNPALRDGTVSSLVLDNKHRVFAYLRRDRTQRVAIVLNDSNAARTVQLTIPGFSGVLTDVLTRKKHPVRAGKVAVQVPATGESVLAQAAGS